MTECTDRDRTALDDLTVLEVVELAEKCWRCRQGCEIGTRAVAFALLLRRLRQPAPSW